MRNKQPETNGDVVKLEPIMGIKPGIYLTFLYSIVLLLVIFVFFALPGLKNPSAVLFVKTEPAGAAIRLNGAYMGVSGKGIPVRAGEYVIEAVMPGFASESSTRDIPGRIFFSVFFPRRYDMEFTLKTDDPKGVLTRAASDFAAWSFGGEPTERWQIPLSLSEGAYRAGKVDGADGILKAASRFAVTRASLRDLVRAKILSDNNGLSPSPIALAGSISDILEFLSENPGSASWLSGLLPPELAKTIIASDWLANDNAIGRIMLPSPGGAARRVELGGLYFMEIPPGALVGGEQRLGVSGFYIGENPIPKTLFALFLKENPEWENAYTDYEKEITITLPQIRDNGIITGITWNAAAAFCQWFSRRLPAGMEARLPTEIEWEYAAMFGVKSAESPLWEWLSDPYAPLQFIQAPESAALAVGSPERALRGGKSFGAESERASLPEGLSSPFVTARIVIARE